MLDCKVLALTFIAVIIAVVIRPNKPHSEAALLTDWSNPPPWPIFIGINAVAGTLRSMADALTPPPIRMLDYSVAYQTSMMAHILQSTKIPDFLATGPKTIVELTTYLETKDELRVERILFTMAADGMTQLHPSMKKGDAPRFVNTALSATLRSDHPNCVSGMVGHTVQDGFESFAQFSKMLGPDAVDNVWHLTYPDYAI